MDKDTNGENRLSSITGGTASLRDKRRKTIQIGLSTYVLISVFHSQHG